MCDQYKIGYLQYGQAEAAAGKILLGFHMPVLFLIGYPVFQEGLQVFLLGDGGKIR